MALAETTLSVAVAKNDKSIVVASATSMAIGRIIRIGDEEMKVAKDYVSASTTVPVLRGWGSPQKAWPASARVVHGAPEDFASGGLGQGVPYPVYGRSKPVREYSATGTMDLPAAGSDQLVVLNGTAITLTVPVPTKDLDGSVVTFVNSAGAAHVLSFTGGLGGAGSGYTTLTFNGTGTVAFSVIACNEVWCGIVQIPAAGTVTNVTATLT